MTLTVQEYLALSPWKRFTYRVMRSPWHDLLRSGRLWYSCLRTVSPAHLTVPRNG